MLKFPNDFLIESIIMFVCSACKYKNHKYLNINIYEYDIYTKKDIYKKKRFVDRHQKKLWFNLDDFIKYNIYYTWFKSSYIISGIECYEYEIQQDLEYFT